jgi:hypothetical protein
MKFYNPFKPHIVQLSNGKYAVRRWSLLAWEYKESWTLPGTDCYWWNSMEHVQKWCTVKSLEEAKALCGESKSKLKPMKVVKVIHG